MSQSNEQEILTKVVEIGTIAGFKVVREKGADHVWCGFDLGGGRTQRVFIRPSGRTPDDKEVVSFFSPCMEIKTGFMKGLSKDKAIDLLLRNEQLFFGRFGLWRFDDHDLLVVSVDQMLDTMEAEEFAANVLSVASIADEYEKEHGLDEF